MNSYFSPSCKTTQEVVNKKENTQRLKPKNTDPERARQEDEFMKKFVALMRETRGGEK